MTSEEHPTVHELLIRVMASVGAIGKGRKAPDDIGGYSFRGVDDVLNALHPALVEHGVVVLPTVLERDVEHLGKRRLVSLHVAYTFTGPRGDQLVADAWGEGADSQDKAAAKAMSTAYKVAMFQALCIPIVDSSIDTESHADVSTDGPRARTGIEQKRLQRLVERHEQLPEDIGAKLLGHVEAKHGWSSLFDAPGDALDYLDGLLDKAETAAQQAQAAAMADADA